MSFPLLTVDPRGACAFDDGLWAKRGADGMIHLSVACADLTEIRCDSPAWAVAAERYSTIYGYSSASPIWPESLLVAHSLSQGEHRRVIACSWMISPSGAVFCSGFSRRIAYVRANIEVDDATYRLSTTYGPVLELIELAATALRKRYPMSLHPYLRDQRETFSPFSGTVNALLAAYNHEATKRVAGSPLLIREEDSLSGVSLEVRALCEREPDGSSHRHYAARIALSRGRSGVQQTMGLYACESFGGEYARFNSPLRRACDLSNQRLLMNLRTDPRSVVVHQESLWDQRALVRPRPEVFDSAAPDEVGILVSRSPMEVYLPSAGTSFLITGAQGGTVLSGFNPKGRRCRRWTPMGA